MNKLKKVLRFWYIYLISIAVAVIGTIYYCDFINKPRNEATITLFVSSYSQDSEKLNNYLESKAPNYLREINIVMVNPKSTDLDYYMVNKGLNQADIFILPESYLFEELIKNQFASLNNEVLNNYFVYETDSYNKGILIHDIGDIDNDLMTFNNEKYDDEKYYLFYRNNSIHGGKLTNSNYDTSLVFTKALLEYE